MPFLSVFRTIQKIDNKKVAAGEQHAEQVGDQHWQRDARKRGAVQLRHDKRGLAGALLAAEETLHLVPRDVVTAITAYCLVAIVQKMLESKRTTFELLQILSVFLMDKTPLNELFEKAEGNEPDIDTTPFLPGFEF